MFSGFYSKCHLAIPVPLFVLPVVYFIFSVTCLAADMPQDSNSTQVDMNQNSGAEVAENNLEENEGNIPSGEEVSSNQEVTPTGPNSVAETPQQSQVETRPARRPFWVSNKMIAFYVIVGIVFIVLLGWFLLKNTGRTRLKIRRTMILDKDLAEHGGEFLIVFNWTKKVLYMPTIIASLIAALLMYLLNPDRALWFSDLVEPKRMIETIGGVWFGIFFINFLIEEYDIRLIVIITSLVSIGFLLLLLVLFEKVNSFFRLFAHLDIFLSWKSYLLVSLVGLLTIAVSWIKGLFYYVVITPNYINIQEGLTETGKQIGRRDFHTSVDTTDLAERLIGFGKIIITYKQSDREPMCLYVWKIGAKAKKLEEMGTKTIVT